jgi:hypothetical protein
MLMEKREKAWGFRLLAIDGSKIHLPNAPEINEEFGTINFTNGKNNEIIGRHGYGLASVMYDVLNKIVILAVLAPAKAYEVDLALEHIKQSREGDLILACSNYPSYIFLAEIFQTWATFYGSLLKKVI